MAFLLLLLLVIGGVPSYIVCSKHGAHLSRAKEVVLQQNLWTMRRAIDFYWQDKNRPPQSLQELVNTGYLRQIPDDPVTKSNQTWVIEREKEPSAPNTPTGIIDVRSGAAGADGYGKPYNQY